MEQHHQHQHQHGFRPPPMGYMGGPPPPGFPGMPPPPFFHHPGQPRPPPGAPPPARGREEEEREKRAAGAWSAHKTETGTYYYNQLSGESTWQRPEGFTGDEDKASSNPVPVSSGG